MGERIARITVACLCSMLLAALSSAPATGSDTALGWHLRAIGAERAWTTATGAGVTVAVVDSGVDAGHPALAGAVLPGRSYVATGAGPRLLAPADPGPSYRRAVAHDDPVGHGTAVAGLIAARPGAEHPGVAPGAAVLPVRVLDDENRYHDSSMVGAAVEWAVDQGADVVNLSLGGHYDSADFAAALDYAERHDVLVVACTGNQGEGRDEPVWFPARAPHVLAVTGTDRDGRRWPTAVTGAETDLAAPSADVAAPAAGGGYRRVTGTSFAAAIVSGAAALVRSAHPELSAAEVRYVLTATARSGGGDLGAGTVDAGEAVGGVHDRLPPPPFVAEGDRAAAPPVWPAAVTLTGGSLLGTAALLLHGRRAARGTSSVRAPGPRNMAG